MADPLPMPSKFLNLKIISLVNMVIGILCFIFQIVSLATTVTYNNSTYVFDRPGIGIWGGVILILAGLVAFFLSGKGGSGWLVGFSLVMSGMAFLVGWILLGYEANNIDMLTHSNCTGWCATWMAMSVLLMLLGICGIFVNFLLSYALIKIFLGNLTVSSVTTVPA